VVKNGRAAARGTKSLLNQVFYRVKQMIAAAVEDGDHSSMPSDNKIADTLTALIAEGTLHPVALEDMALDQLLCKTGRCRALQGDLTETILGVWLPHHGAGAFALIRMDAKSWTLE
jgi:hypothetical protein